MRASWTAERVLHRIVMLPCLRLIDRVSHIAVELPGHIQVLCLDIVLVKVELVIWSTKETLHKHRVLVLLTSKV